METIETFVSTVNASTKAGSVTYIALKYARSRKWNDLHVSDCQCMSSESIGRLMTISTS